jgi:hypothetical protein
MLSEMQTAKRTFRRARFRNKTLRRPFMLARHRSLAPQDAFLASYPRSGTTWMRFLLYETLTGESSGFGLMRQAIPSVGKQDGARPVLQDGGKLVQTHEPYCDRDRRVVYVVRDARSVVSSEFAWQQRSGFYFGGFDGFVADFVAGRSNPWGSWADHVRYWRRSEAARNGHIHLVRYEDLRADTYSVFTGILDFLGVRARDDVVRKAVESNSLEGMRAKEDRAEREGWRRSARPDIRFINTGTVTGWRDKLTTAQARLIEQRFGDTLESLGYELSSASSTRAP